MCRIAVQVEDDGDAIGADPLDDALWRLGGHVGEMLEGALDPLPHGTRIAGQQTVGEHFEGPAVDPLPQLHHQVHARMRTEVRRHEADAQPFAGPARHSRPRHGRGWSKHRRRPFGGDALLLRRRGHRQQRKDAESVPPVDASIEDSADARVQLREPVPRAMALPDVRVDAERVRMLGLDGKRTSERRFGVVVPALQDAQRGDIRVDARILGREPCRFAEARLRRGKVPGLHSSERALHPAHRGRREVAVAILEALAAAAGAGGVARGGRRGARHPRSLS